MRKNKKQFSLINFLVDRKLARNTDQASQILLATSIFFIIIFVLIQFFRNTEQVSQKHYDNERINDEYYKNIRVHSR